jgi:hypothetical protein
MRALVGKKGWRGWVSMGREEDIGRKREEGRGKREERKGQYMQGLFKNRAKNAMFRSLELKKYVIAGFFHKIIHENLA